MMRIIFLVMLPLAWTYGAPNSRGGGAYAYVDSSGNRYGGTYGLKDGKVVSRTGDPIPEHFADTLGGYQGGYQGDDFGPAYFGNLENLLQEFPAYDFPSYQGFPFGGDYGMPQPGPNYGNSAFASAAAGPGYQHHVASIYPSNPGNPNVDEVNHFSDTSVPNKSGFYSVSSKSFASSSNVNGKESSNRGAETVVNNNGKVTHYKVQS